jgi:diguanylate cyclase (GGDEF)-like protein
VSSPPIHDVQPIAAPDDFRRSSLPRTITLIAIVLAAIIATAALTARSLSRLVNSQAALTGSLLLEDTLKSVAIGMLEAETGARGFLLTGRATCLRPYYEGLTKLVDGRDALNVALHEDPALAGNLDSVNEAISAKVRVTAREVALKSEGRTDELMALVLADMPQDSMDTLRADLLALSAPVQLRIEEHRLEHARVIHITYWIVAGSIALNLTLLIVLVLRMRYAAAQARLTREAMAVGNAELSRLLEAMAGRHEQTLALSELSRFLQSCADTDEAGRVLRQQLPLMMQAGSGALYLFSASRNQLRQTFSWGEATFAGFLDPAECWGLRFGQPYRQTAQGGAPLCQHLTSKPSEGGRDMDCLPLVAHGDLMGLLVLESGAVGGRRITAEEEDHRRMTLEQVALSIGNLQLRESLRQQSIRDPLTGLYNRRFLEEAARREVLRASRLQAQGGLGGMALLMLDIDHFKRFNDQHGHEVGDRVLREVGQLLQRVTRDSDVAARYGGEEFTIVMTDTTAELGLQRAEQIRSEVERMAIEALGKAVGEVTISIGLAQFPTHGSSMETLFRAADKALYHAKHTGRNRVVAAA